MWLPLVFFLVPLIEISLFVVVGGRIGLWPTLAIVLATGFLGAILLRTQGLRTLTELQRSVAEFRDPTAPIAHGAMMLLAGAFLLTPGFFTDTLGFLLLVPSVRNFILARVARRLRRAEVRFDGAGIGQRQDERDAGGQRGDVIDADYEEVDPPPRRNRPSGWTEH
jgi:UPF0716 protein FxsA